MNSQQPIEHIQRTVFEHIRNGMNVFDRNGDRLGHVESVFFGADADTRQEYSAGAATAPDPSTRPNSFVEAAFEAIFDKDDLPDTLRNRLMNDGFIQVKGEGLFTPDRYVLREQIARVSGDDVHLNVTRDELIER